MLGRQTIRLCDSANESGGLMSQACFRRSTVPNPAYSAHWLLLIAAAFALGTPRIVPADDGQKDSDAPRPPRLANDQEQETWRQLHELTVVNFIETPLEDTVTYLADYHRLAIRFDEPALPRAVLERGQKVTLRLNGAPLNRVFKLLLGPFACHYVIEGCTLVVTTRAEAEKRSNHWIYDVRDLLGDGFAPEELTEAIAANVDVSAWDRVGGPGTVRIEGHELLVRQSSKTRARLDGFLKQVRAALSRQDSLAEFDKAPTRSHTYRIDDLRVLPGADDDLAEALSDALFIDMLRSAVLSPTWRTRGGEGLIDLRDGRLLVRQTDEGHRAIAEFLQLLRARLDQPLPLTRSEVEIAAGMAWDLKFDPLATQAALRRPQSFQYDDIPWPRLFKSILKRAGIEALVARDPMVTLGIDENALKSLHAREESLSSCLGRLADSVGVDWYVYEVGCVEITTPELAARSREIRLHSIAGCLLRGMTKSELIARITSTVAPGSWAATDSPATIRPLGSFLVVNHNRKTQDEIARLLKSIEE